MSLSRSILGDNSFLKENFLLKRKAEAERVLAKYPDRVPVIVEQSSGNKLPSIDKTKFLVPNDLTIGQFVYVIRKRIKLSPEKAIFLMVDSKLPATSALLSQVYQENKDEDSFLHDLFRRKRFWIKIDSNNYLYNFIIKIKHFYNKTVLI